MLKVTTLVYNETKQNVFRLCTDNDKVAYVCGCQDENELISVDHEWGLDFTVYANKAEYTILPERQITGIDNLYFGNDYPYFICIMPYDKISQVSNFQQPRVVWYEGYSELICICSGNHETSWGSLGSLELDQTRPEHEFSIGYKTAVAKQRLMELARLLG